MSQKLSNEELSNVSGGGCNHPHELVPAKIYITYYYNKSDHDLKYHWEDITVYYDTRKFEDGTTLREYAEKWCNQNQYKYAGSFFYSINNSQSY